MISVVVTGKGCSVLKISGNCGGDSRNDKGIGGVLNIVVLTLRRCEVNTSCEMMGADQHSWVPT